MSRISANLAEPAPLTAPDRVPLPLPAYLQKLIDEASDSKGALDRRFRAAHDLLTFGYIDKAKEILNTMPPSARRTARLARIDQIEAGEALLKHVVPEAETEMHEQLGRKLSGIMIIPSQEPTPFALIFFGGNGERNFTLPHQLINRKHMHMIFLKDSQRCFSLAEISRLGPTYETNLPRLKRILEELEATSVYCLGTSAGAFPALKFGLELEAQSVLAFSGTPSLEIADDPGATMAKYPQLLQLYKKARHLGTSMVTEYMNSRSHPSVTFVYGEKNERDAFFASRMAGVKGVDLDPIEGFSGHGAFTESLSRDIFPGLLDQLFCGERIINS